jgi:hypothetical protein
MRGGYLRITLLWGGEPHLAYGHRGEADARDHAFVKERGCDPQRAFPIKAFSPGARTPDVQARITDLSERVILCDLKVTQRTAVRVPNLTTTDRFYAV